jgi:peptidoglycan L-alanyl-D-glutamate endopeptidase CwlK
MCSEFINRCKAEGIDVIITSTYRDAESQNKLYAQGRTEPGKKVTNAKAGQSFHNWRVAFDFVPIVGGKAIWNDDALWAKCGEIAEGVGLEWAGRWTKFKETAHCQYTGGLSLADFQAGKTL